MLNQLRQRLGTKRQSRPDRQPSGTIWPNGEFSLSWPKVNTHLCNEESERGESVWSGEQLVSRRALASLCDEIHASQLEPEPNRNRQRYGLKGITNRGKRFVRSAACLLQREHGRRLLSFLTLTLPEMGLEEALALGEAWPKVVNRMIEWLTRRLRKAGLDGRLVGVTEVQTKRLAGGSVPVLHLHIVFQGKSSLRSPWALRPLEIRRQWLALISRHAGVELHSDACEEIKVVKASAESYLGKYMSKGTEAAALMVAAGLEKLVPRQWWFATKGMKDAVKAGTVRGRAVGEVLEKVIEWAMDEGAKCAGCYLRPVLIDWCDAPLLVAWVGRLNRALADDLTAMLKSGLGQIRENYAA